MSRTKLAALFGALFFSILSVPAFAAPPANTPGLDERWLSQSVLNELARACEKGDYKELGEQVETLIFERLACGHVEQLAAVTDLVYVMRACKYLPMTHEGENRKLAEWLVKNRDASRLLFRALGDVKSAEASLKKFKELWADDEKAALEYAQLAVALATSDPRPLSVKPPNPLGLAARLKWFTQPKVPYRYDLRKMPYELSRHVVNSQLSLNERQWAVQKYAGRANLASAYSDLEYDGGYLSSGKKRISQFDYTLQNLAKVGGVCIDQAYYAGEICKSLGVPSAIVIGRGPAGIGHAWVACLRIGANMAEWEAGTGRIAQQAYSTGYVIDPATGERIQDSELALLGAVAQLSLARREQADAATAAAALLAHADKPPDVAGLAELKKLADAYNQQAAAKPAAPGKPADKADLTAFKPDRDLNEAMVEELLKQAAGNNIAHARVWELVIELQKAGKLSAEALDRLFEVLIATTAGQYPDYSCDIVLQIVPTLDKPETRQKAYEKALGVYGRRADLGARLMLAIGDDFRKQGDTGKALKTYEHVIAKTAGLTEVLMDATERAEELLLTENKREAAIKMYTQLFQHAKKIAITSNLYEGTAHYLLGKRLVKLLDDDGQEEAADRVRTIIGENDPPGK